EQMVFRYAANASPEKGNVGHGDTMAPRILMLMALLFAKVYVADAATNTESTILSLMATVPKGLHCGVGVEWYRFEEQQHDGPTLTILRRLFREHNDEGVRRMALSCLSCQKCDDLVAFWDDILKSEKKKDLWLLALRGLGSINTPESNTILLGLLSNSSTTPELLRSTCHILSETAPAGGLDAISPLTRHASAPVRLAALEAVLALGADAAPFLRQALTDDDAQVTVFGLGRLGPNPDMQFVPRMFELLTNANVKVRAETDEALRYLLSHAAMDNARRFDLFQQALMDHRWDYAMAPLLTSRYAIGLESRGRLQEASMAYETAENSYSTNSAYKDGSDNSGATMLYRLFQVKRKMGDLDSARAVLRRMTTKYRDRTQVYLEDNPGIVGLNASHMEFTVREVTSRLATYLDRLPITVTVAARNATVDTNSLLQFELAIENVTSNALTLHCTRVRSGTGLVPACRPTVVQDGGWTTFDETWFLAGKPVEKIALKPHESFAFTATLPPITTKGVHVFDIMLSPTCTTASGTNWTDAVVANSVVVEVK
ncbi:MAG: hypothetical protein WCS01_14515, partial [bacterium]